MNEERSVGVESHYDTVYPHNDDVIKLRSIPHYWPFVRGIHRSPVNAPLTKATYAELWFFFFDLRLNKRLSKQPRRRWFDTPLCPLWRQCNVLTNKAHDKLFRAHQLGRGMDCRLLPLWALNLIHILSISLQCYMQYQIILDCVIMVPQTIVSSQDIRGMKIYNGNIHSILIGRLARWHSWTAGTGYNFDSRKYISKGRRQDGSFFVLASICWNAFRSIHYWV